MPNTVGPDPSWRLVHDDIYYYSWFESGGYTTSIYVIEEFVTEAEGVARIAALGLVNINPPEPPPEPPVPLIE